MDEVERLIASILIMATLSAVWSVPRQLRRIADLLEKGLK